MLLSILLVYGAYAKSSRPKRAAEAFWPKRADGRLCGRIPIKVVARDARNASLLVGTGFRHWHSDTWTSDVQPRPPGHACRLVLHAGTSVLVSQPLETHRLQGGVLVIARWEGAGDGDRVELLSRFDRKDFAVIADARPRAAVAAAAVFRKGRTPYAERPTAWDATETRRRLALWVAHHRAVGFERMYVVDNAPTEPSFRLAPADDVVYVSTSTPFNLPHPTAGKDPWVPGQLAIETALLAAVRADWLLVSDADEFLYMREGIGARDLVRAQSPRVGAVGVQPLKFWSKDPYDKKLVGTPCAAKPASMNFHQALYFKRKNFIRTSAAVALSVHYVTLKPGFDAKAVGTAGAFLAHFRFPYGLNAKRNPTVIKPRGTAGYMDVEEKAVRRVYEGRTKALCGSSWYLAMASPATKKHGKRKGFAPKKHPMSREMR